VAIETTAGGGFVVTGEADIQVYRLLAIRRGLKLEIETGMKMSRGVSMMKLAKATCQSSKNTKRGVYADYDAFLVSSFPTLDSAPLRP